MLEERFRVRFISNVNRSMCRSSRGRVLEDNANGTGSAVTADQCSSRSASDPNRARLWVTRVRNVKNGIGAIH
jgi:hypothetical protein